MSAPESNPTVTQRDVARSLGLSHSTVSLALRNSPKITQARREEIQKAAETMGYRPNPMAAALAQFKRTSKTAPVHAALAWFNFWERPKDLRALVEFDCYWRGAFSAAEKLGYRLEEFTGDYRTGPARLERILTHRGINGILLPPHRVTPEWGSFNWENFSIVRFGRSIPVPRVHIVTADQVANMMIAFEESRIRGYRRIGYITGGASSRGALFDAGFLRAQLSVAEKERLPILTIDQQNPFADLPKVREWAGTYKPDAVLTDVPFTPELLQKAGYRVPDDIGIAAMSVLDGNADAGIYQNPEEIGRVALLVLVSLIGDNSRGIPPIFRQVLVEGRFVDGSSLPSRI